MLESKQQGLKIGITKLKPTLDNSSLPTPHPATHPNAKT